MSGEIKFGITLSFCLIMAFKVCNSMLKTISLEPYVLEKSNSTLLILRFGYKCQNTKAGSVNECIRVCMGRYKTKPSGCAGIDYNLETKQCGMCGESDNYLDPTLKKVSGLGGIKYISE